MKAKKIKKQLEARIKEWENTGRNSKTLLHKPGSLNPRKTGSAGRQGRKKKRR